MDSSSSMASETHVSASILDTHPMIFNVRLVFARTNIHNAQLFKDPMNHWIVKIEEHPIAFDPTPWVNYQGETYMVQEGVSYQVTTSVDKWGQLFIV